MYPTLLPHCSVASFTASGDLSKAATGGTFKITITLFGIPVMNMSGNLCNSKYVKSFSYCIVVVPAVVLCV